MNYTFAWLRGPAGSPTDYYHSEGACCQADVVDVVEGAHKACRIDIDYTLRRALTIDEPILEWCGFCGGKSSDCIFCHSAIELISGQNISQYERAKQLCGWLHL